MPMKFSFLETWILRSNPQRGAVSRGWIPWDRGNVSSLMWWHKSFWFHERAAPGEIFGWIIPPVIQSEGDSVKIWGKKDSSSKITVTLQ